ncbi:hypothetical protein, partial [Rubrivirga sp.]|uniref:hypothetical protein n=1 Tax=Rubrivirga sp. TaxID=1885344 RepID=UPI003C7281B2
DLYDPIGSAVRVGTSLEKRRQARRAQAKLDSVVARVDIADRIARRVLAESADRMRVSIAQRPDQSDYLLDLRIYDYALVADSFEGAVYFVLLGEVLLLDATSGAVLWDSELAEREILDRSRFGALFGLPATVGNVVTGQALSDLSAQDMATGLGRLADFVADQIAERLTDDYYDSRRAYERRAAE